MGYYVRFLPRKKNSPVWKVQFVSYKRKDQRDASKAKEKKRAWDVSKERWRALGFHLTITIEEAKVRAKQLNAQLQLKRQEERIKAIYDKEFGFKLRNSATLPEEFVAEFEERFIRARNVFSNHQKRSLSRRRYTTWRAAQKIIAKAGIEPTNWFYHQDCFYDLFYEKQYSPGYVKSILAIDQLLTDQMWRTEILPTGRKILWIFQTKIIALPLEDRWKPIPLIFDEQHFALKMIADKNFKRPLTKTIHKYIGEGHDTYGGRKGFVDLMLSKNQRLENISIWMGHSTLSRTWRSYKNKRIYHSG